MSFYQTFKFIAIIKKGNLILATVMELCVH